MKLINDNLGHSTGDQVLIDFYHELLFLKTNGKIEFYRYRGDEFVALVYEYKDEKFNQLSSDIHQAANNIKIDEKPIITISVGIAYLNKNENGSIKYDQWLIRADEAVYETKHNGRNQTCYK